MLYLLLQLILKDTTPEHPQRKRFRERGRETKRETLLVRAKHRLACLLRAPYWEMNQRPLGAGWSHQPGQALSTFYETETNPIVLGAEAHIPALLGSCELSSIRLNWIQKFTKGAFP